jgi:hypothetical protein
MAEPAARLPKCEALAFYIGLGEARSYRAVAEKYGVSKRAVVEVAKRHGWADKLRDIEEEAAKRLRDSQVASIVEARERHLKSLKALQAKALSGLRERNVRTVGEAARALEAAIKLERLILGESTSNTTVSIHERQQREVDQLLVEPGDGAAETAQEDDDGEDE